MQNLTGKPDVETWFDGDVWDWVQEKDWDLVRLGGFHPNEGGFGFGQPLHTLPEQRLERRLVFRRLHGPTGASVEVYPDLVVVGVGGIGRWRYTGYFRVPADEIHELASQDGYIA